MELGLVYAVHAVFFFLIDLFVFWMTFSKRKDSTSQHSFSYFAVTITTLQLMAMGVILHEHGIASFNPILLNVLYVLLISLPAVAAYTAIRWLGHLFSMNDGKWPSWFNFVSVVPLVLYVLMSMASIKTQWIFYLDENLEYHRGSLFALQILVPYCYVVWFIVLAIRENLRKKSFPNKKAVKFIAVYLVPPVVGSFIQTAFNLHGCFSEMGASVGLLLAYIGMYMGDAEEHRRVKDLADLNEKLQFANEQMRRILMRGELQAKTVAETIHGGFKIGKYDKNFSFVYISEQLANMLGYTVQEMMEASGGSMAGLVKKDEVRQELDKAREQIRAGNVYTLNYRLRCKDGSWKHVEERGRLIKTEGAEDEFWSVILDKDEIVQVETALANVEKSRKELAEYNDIIATAGMGIWFVTLQEGKPGLMHGNKKLYELMGIDGDSMTWEEIHEFLAGRILPEDLPVFGAAIEKMKNGQFAEALYRWNHPTKGVIYNRCGGTAVRLSDGSYNLSGYHGDATEIVRTEQKQQELLKNALVAAEESNRAKTAFLNNMSHDIRTPMNAILGFASLIEKDCEQPEKVRGHLKKVKDAGDFLLSLINNVLELARIESGKVELNETPAALQDNAEGTLNMFEAAFHERNLNSSLVVNIQHNYVYVDTVKMREVIANLVSNAVKYSESGGRIVTSLTEVPCKRVDYAAYDFVVEDDGIGMSKEFLPHLFDSFVRERNSTESKISGTGLGLPIVKKLVDLMGGTISVESTLGKGTKFMLHFEYRLCTENDVLPKKTDENFEKAHLKGCRILLVEDNDLNAEIAESLLQDIHLEVVRAVDGYDCLKKLENAPTGYFDVVLMDVQMPNMDGYEATRRIRQMENDRIRNIPIVAMTANAFDEDRRAAITAGMNAHVAKPIDMGLLVKTLNRFI